MNDAGNSVIDIPKNESRTMDLRDSDGFFNCRISNRYVNWSVRYPQGENIVDCKLNFNVDVEVNIHGGPYAWNVKVSGCDELVKEATCGELGCHNNFVDYYAMKNKSINIIFQ
ncbi:hypothetical protein [Xenorhabdus sp. Sc-CR9]|uniref:hypothetical protein n=1 Tax=Xenorhabdus sp. Sc-CR9 TaxID=2584468 RepID=UPI001F358C84|nr:hypothetical protein [Xenorhabdus sp. Sc-CR9]